MTLATLLTVILGLFWILPAVVLVLLYLDIARNVAIPSPVARFCHNFMLGLERALYTVNPYLTRHRPSETVRKDCVNITSRRGKFIHDPEKITPSGRLREQLAEEPIELVAGHTCLPGEFVSVRVSWKEGEEITSVEEWLLGLN